MKVCGGRSPLRNWLGVSLSFGLTASILSLNAPAARAYESSWRHRHHAVASAETYNPSYAAIVVDENTGREIYGVNENAPRHPASITKVMTLYLLFEQLEKGSMTLETPIRISEHAAAQEPSKLGIAAGDSLTVEEAIKAVVTRSANDVAVAIAEAIGHDETTFADMMTRKAHAIGMSRTLYRNASGLPNDEQLTTAHDLTVLARSLEERFPQYFKYFSTHEFVYDGEVIGNHNHLLGRIDGVDGIKTGFTRASGFNLLTSVHRDGRSLVAVVMGGRSAGARDHAMEELIDAHLAECTDHGHTATMIADNESPVTPSSTAGRRQGPTPQMQVASYQAPKAAAKALDEGEGDKSDDEETAAPVKAAPAVVKPAPAPIEAKTEPKPAARVTAPAAPIPPTQVKTAAADPAVLGWKKGPDPVKREAATPARVAPKESVKEAAKPAPEREETRVARSEHAANEPPHSGWIIQIGASDAAAKASALLSRAQGQDRELASAKPFTEKFVKGGDTFYRARFAGLDSSRAELACKSLRREGFSCFATHLD